MELRRPPLHFVRRIFPIIGKCYKAVHWHRILTNRSGKEREFIFETLHTSRSKKPLSCRATFETFSLEAVQNRRSFRYSAD
jgi:hypothetical protein